MPKDNPGFRDIGGDAPGATKMAFSLGEGIEVARASYDVNYWLGGSMSGLPMSALKRGYMPGCEPGSDDEGCM